MKNGENNKLKDVVAILTFVIAFFIVFFIITKGKYLYGSATDWEAQHYLIPEYFRNLFYQTKDLFPDFASHLGGGQNIYYFSYYGLLNPFVLFSYLLPFVEMVDYIQALGCIIPIVSTIIFYFYLKKHTSYNISFFLAFLFLGAGPIIFHSHRHLMFINYFPFFMMALYGIDSFFEKNKIFLLLTSCFLIIMTSYYYSVGSLIALFCYGIYYGVKHKKWDKKRIIKFFIPFIVAILMNMVILLPTLYTLLSGRTAGADSLNFLSLITPKRSFRFLLYETYALGLTSVSLISTVYLLFTKKRENVFLGFIILVISLFPICNYILNGTLYINAKSLIPFLPIILIFMIEFIELLLSYKISYKKLILIIISILLFTNSKLLYIDLIFISVIVFSYYKFKRDIFLFIPISLFAFAICVKTNLTDTLEAKTKIEALEYKAIEDAVDYILNKEENIYRINTLVSPYITMNKVVDEEHYTSSIYSSTFNKDYNKFYFDTMGNANPTRNRSMTPSVSNYFFERLMGGKYIITTGNQPFGSHVIYEKDNVKVCELDYVNPIGYASSNLISLYKYKQLSYPDNIISLFNGIVVEDGNNEGIEIEKNKIDFEILSKENIEYSKNGDTYKFKALDKANMKLKLKGDYSNKFIFVRLNNSYNPPCDVSELSITINGIKNTLSCSTWKYHNNNYIFDYIFYDTGILNINFGKGNYEFSDIKIYSISKDDFISIISEKDEFIFDKKGTLGDTIRGTIEVSNDGYFKMSIPYDKGFRAWIDGRKIKIEKVDETFIGFKISKGYHDIKIVYESPYKKEGLIVSFIGVLLFIGIVVYEKRK